MAPSRAWIADFVGDQLVLGVEAVVVKLIVVVPAVGLVRMCFCRLVVALVTVEFIVVGYTHTKHTKDEQSESSMLFGN